MRILAPPCVASIHSTATLRPMTSIYFAAPLFTAAERSWNADVVGQLRTAFADNDILWSIPQEFCAQFDNQQPIDHGEIFDACHQHVAAADVVIAILDGPDVDSGTAWEAGFAFARDKTVIGLRTDFRPAEDGAGNCMLTRSCATICTSPGELIDAIRPYLSK